MEEETRRKIDEMDDMGMTMPAIADALGIKYGSVRAHLRKRPTLPRKRGRPPKEIGPTKVCSDCQRPLPRDSKHFHLRKSSSDGLMSFCISCNVERCVRKQLRDMAKTDEGRAKLAKLRARHITQAKKISQALAGKLPYRRGPVRATEGSEQ